MSLHIVLTGATGLLGRTLLDALHARGERLTILTRNPVRAADTVPRGARVLLWAPGVTGEWKSAIDGADVVIHLAGEPIAAGRWTAARKQRILDSRVRGTRDIVGAIEAATTKPRLLLSASAVGYYGENGDDVVDETAAAGTGFLAEVCSAWEQEARRAASSRTRVVMTRLGVVLTPRGGALGKMLPAFRFFVGGPIGPGTQWFPWVHLDDVIGIMLHAIDNASIEGALNVVSPGIVRNRDFATALGDALGRPAMFGVPAAVIRLLFGELGETLLGSQRVHPTRTLASGYQFHYNTIDRALANLFNR